MRRLRMGFKGRALIVLAAVLAAVCLVPDTAFAGSTGFIESAYLSPSGAGILCLDAQADSTHTPYRDGDNVQLWDCLKTYNQTWTVIATDSTWGEIKNLSGLCLDAVASGATTPGDNVQLWTCSGQPQQLWTYVPAGNGRYYIENRYGLYLDAVNDGSHNPAQNGDNVQLWSFNGGPQQTWY